MQRKFFCRDMNGGLDEGKLLSVQEVRISCLFDACLHGFTDCSEARRQASFVAGLTFPSNS